MHKLKLAYKLTQDLTYPITLPVYCILEHAHKTSKYQKMECSGNSHQPVHQEPSPLLRVKAPTILSFPPLLQKQIYDVQREGRGMFSVISNF